MWGPTVGIIDVFGVWEPFSGPRTFKNRSRVKIRSRWTPLGVRGQISRRFWLGMRRTRRRRMRKEEEEEEEEAEEEAEDDVVNRPVAPELGLP